MKHSRVYNIVNQLRSFRSRLLTLPLLAGILILSVLFGPTASFVLSATPPQPTYALATVDGSIGEWVLNNDFFANMREAAKPDKPILSKLYLHYDC